MSKEIWEWSAVAAGNQDFPPSDGGWPEGMSRQDVNDSSRQNLATLRRHYNDSEWIRPRIQGPSASQAGVFARTGANTCTITLGSTDLSSYFRAGRVVRIINGSGAGVDLVTQCSIDATYLSGVTTITVKAAINVAATDIYTHTSSVLRAQALLDDNSQFFIPATADSAGIQAAINAASAAGGGIVFLNQNSYTVGTQIDVTGTNGNVIIWGKSPQVTLLRTAGIGSMLNFSNTTEAIEIRNVRFDGDWLANPSGNGYGLSLANCPNALIDNCEFVRCETGIKLIGNTVDGVSIRDCRFTFHRHGVASSSATEQQTGTIRGCRFDGSLMSLPAPAAIKVAGAWTISGNYLFNVGHATLVPVGIWVWDKTAPLNGGWQTTVEGNVIITAAATGIGIWMGADEGICIGNTVRTALTGTGIRLGSLTAGQAVERCVVSGNSITQGAIGIQVTEFALYCNVQGNAVGPLSGTAILNAGNHVSICGNTMRISLIGIDLIATAANCLVDGNAIYAVTSDAIIVRALASANMVTRNQITGAPTRGINVELGAVATLVVDNYAPAMASPLTNLEPTTRIARNQQLVNHSQDTDNASSGTVDLMTNDLPGGGGIGDYLVEWDHQNNVASACTVALHFGATGSPASDTQVDSNSIGASANDLSQFRSNAPIVVSVTDALWTQWSVRKTGASSDIDIAFRITKISEPLG